MQSGVEICLMILRHLFSNFNEKSRVWLFLSDKSLSENKAGQLLSRAKIFMNKWESHGHPVNSDVIILMNHLLVLTADESDDFTGGCSIDGMMREVQQWEMDLDIKITNRLIIGCVKNERMEVFPINEVKSRIEKGLLKQNDYIIDLSVHNIHELKNQLLIPATNSFLKKYFHVETNF